MRQFRYLISVIFIVLLTPVMAESPSRYGDWQATQTPDQPMLDELSRLIDGATKQRAADPVFLRDLRDLVRRYDRPWRTSLLFDDFSDANYTHTPAWSVASGQFSVDQHGLRSAVSERPADTTQSEQDNEDLGKALFGALLQELAKDNKHDNKAPDTVAYTPAEIHSRLALSNAFDIQLQFTSWQGSGELGWGPYIAASRNNGYRLNVSSGPQFVVELQRVHQNGIAVIDVYKSQQALTAGQVYSMQWTRHADGEMHITLDGKELIHATDRSYTRSFTGFSLHNRRGDFSIRRVVINGTS